MGWLKKQTGVSVAGDDTDVMRAALGAFDRGALAAYTSIRFAVAQLSKEEALDVIDDAIARLQRDVG